MSQNDARSGKECSMCGDVGFIKELLRCKKCLHRLQHRYCSRGYPDIRLDEYICDWCYGSKKSSTVNDGPKPSGTESRSDTPDINWHQYKNDLEFFVEVAEHEASDACATVQRVEQQLVSNKDTVWDNSKRHRCITTKKSRLVLDEWKPHNKTKLRLSAASKGSHGGRRYKLLSDVLCQSECNVAKL
ncbi:hypothetical protein O6H91_17G056200 [Diphasiastrum complanatum]|uniref:Uncharacterized protein n=1 Tax=Diphasiastrum complanatum TaxID=34168 RepID=A0ACC2B6Z4_DIPCM|nr:hypothetical protein O6H91_Y468300 [Diphasiastrum complanatum]KAJ7525551.1 hypothetical protein O6H91_17G056200 [Diphasiastrum complanatum]